MLRNLIDLQKKLYPDLLNVMRKRYLLLYSIALFQPIGRRGLAENTGMTERVVRSEVDFLHKQSLINVTAKGMHLTKEGKLILEQLADHMREIMGLNVLEKQIKDKLQVEHVIVVPGNSDEHAWIKQEMGKACVSYLQKIIKEETTIAVTGGTTIAAIADVMAPLKKGNNYLFVPARGGLGEKVENQANSISANMAKKTNGEYRLLYAPELLSEESYKSIINEPSINEILQLIKGADIVLHGVGDALAMAKRRKAADEVIAKLKLKKAVGEAFGYYFNKDGEVVHKVRTVGLQLEDLASIKHVITVAGGKSKGRAITAYFQTGRSDVLITDEGAAMEIVD